MAGALASTAVFTKLNLALPLPFLAILMLVFGRADRFMVFSRPGSTRVGAAVCAGLAVVLVSAAWSSLMNWTSFCGEWFGLATGKEGPVGIGEVVLSVGQGVARTLAALSPEKLAPAPTRYNFFFFCEFGFICMAAVGLAALAVDRSLARGRWGWFLVYALVPGALWIYRAGRIGFGHNYLFPMYAGLSALAVVGFCALLKRQPCDSGLPSWRALAAVSVLTMILHHSGFWCAVSLKREDVRSYRLHEAGIREALACTQAGDRVAIRARRQDYPPAGLMLQFVPVGTRSVLVDAVLGRFVELPAGLAGPAARAWCQGKGIRGIVEVGEDGQSGYHDLSQDGARP